MSVTGYTDHTVHTLHSYTVAEKPHIVTIPNCKASLLEGKVKFRIVFCRVEPCTVVSRSIEYESYCTVCISHRK